RFPARLAAMSEALASSSVTIPPGQQQGRARVRPSSRPVQLGTRYLGLISMWAVAVGLSFKSELLSPSQVWQATAALAVLVTLGLVFLHARNRTPAWLSLDHYISPVLVIVAAAAFSILAPDYRVHALAMLTMGAVTFGAFGMVTYLNQGSQYVAVILAFAWYAWQGLTVHALDDSLTRRILFEYGLFAVICVYLIALALVTGRPIG